MMINSVITGDFFDLANAKNAETQSNRLRRALKYRELLYPILEEYLSPHNSSILALQFQQDLDKSSNTDLDLDLQVAVGKSSSIQNEDIKALYDSKFLKAQVFNQFIDKLFDNPADFALDFDTPPSVNDKTWTKTLLVYDFLYYGPVTILCLERILREYPDFDVNPLYPMLYDVSANEVVTEIRVNNYKDIFFECGNKSFQWQIPFLSDHQLLSVTERIINETNLINNSSVLLNASSPIADFEHPCGYIRGAAVIPPASETPIVTLRLHPDEPYTLDQLKSLGMLDQEMCDFLCACQQAGTTIVIAGTMGSGKTTILSALSEFWPDKGRKATIEDTPELRPRIDDLIKMRTIEYGREDVSNIDVTRLTKACKRHSVRYVVLSEARDSSAWEILQLSQAILGCLMTFHYTVRSDKFLVDQALNTLVALSKQHPLAPVGDDIKHQVASIVQILLLIEQDPVDNVRRVIKIYYVTGYDELNGGHFKATELFSFDKEGRQFCKMNISKEFEEYLAMKGVGYKF